jgi:hypothetical protein
MVRKEILSVVAVVALFAACQQQAPAPAPAPAEEHPAATEAAPAATEAPATEAAPAAEASFGVPECDDYVQKYLACIDEHVPEAAQEQLRAAFDQTRSAWQQAAATDTGKAGLAAACTQAMDAAKTSMASYGCNF